jgi:hypothetical protein
LCADCLGGTRQPSKASHPDLASWSNLGTNGICVKREVPVFFGAFWQEIRLFITLEQGLLFDFHRGVVPQRLRRTHIYQQYWIHLRVRSENDQRLREGQMPRLKGCRCNGRLLTSLWVEMDRRGPMRATPAPVLRKMVRGTNDREIAAIKTAVEAAVSPPKGAQPAG